MAHGEPPHPKDLPGAVILPNANPRSVPSVFPGGVDPGFHVFGYGMTDRGAGAHDVSAILAAGVNEHFGMIPHLINGPRGQR